MGGWIDGCSEKKKVLCNEDYKTMTCCGPFSAVPTLAAVALLHTDEVEFSTVTCKTDKHTQASMYGIFSPLEGLCIGESGSRMRVEVGDYASDDHSKRGAA